MMKLKFVVVSILIINLAFLPLLPYIEYYSFKQYIIENLCVNRDIPNSCCQGKCYLEKKVSEATENEKNETKAPTLKKVEVLPYLIPAKFNFCNDMVQTINYSGFINNRHGVLFKKAIFRPPERCFIYAFTPPYV